MMLQFVCKGYIIPITLTARSMHLLELKGWCFIKIKNNTAPNLNAHATNIKTCVNLCKYYLNMHAPTIQTPKALYKKLKRL